MLPCKDVAGPLESCFGCHEMQVSGYGVPNGRSSVTVSGPPACAPDHPPVMCRAQAEDNVHPAARMWAWGEDDSTSASFVDEDDPYDDWLLL